MGGRISKSLVGYEVFSNRTFLLVWKGVNRGRGGGWILGFVFRFFLFSQSNIKNDQLLSQSLEVVDF